MPDKKSPGSSNLFEMFRRLKRGKKKKTGDPIRDQENEIEHLRKVKLKPKSERPGGVKIQKKHENKTFN